MLALRLYAGYAADRVHHDRNGHFGAGLNLAIAARSFDILWFLSELERAKVWPPFHALLLGTVLLIGGIDYRLAIVPSLLGWAVTVVFSALIARRLFDARTPGLFAAAWATIFVTVHIHGSHREPHAWKYGR